MGFEEFLLDHFWSPGYTLVNTLTYALILFGCVYFLIKVFEKIGFRIDYRFFIATLPFIFFGSTARELVDRGFGLYPGYALYPGNFFWVAPGIYFSMFVLTSGVLLACFLGFRVRYHIPMAGFGVLLCSYNVYLIYQNIGLLHGFFLTMFFFCLSSFLAYVLIAQWGGSIISGRDPFYINFSLILAHLLDASATFIGVDFMGFREKHVVPNYLIERFGSSVVMFPLKILVVGFALHVIDEEYEKDDLSRIFIKFVVLILGLGPALRDLTLIALN